MRITEVKTQTDIAEFHLLPFNIYRKDENWIPHLKQDIEKKFHETGNKHFDGTNAKRWIVKTDYGKLIGRIAAFIHPKTAYSGEYPVGGIGFFECIKNPEAAKLLFNTAKNWLEEKGMKAMDGPVNFGERDQFWGLLIKNFTSPPTYGMNYNPPYYLKLFEDYGFKEYFQQFMYHRMVNDPVQEVFVKKADILQKDKNFRCSTVKNRSTDQIAEDFVNVYNDAWGNTREGFKAMKKEQALKIVRALKPVMDPNIVFFAYYNERPIGFYINVPEMNQIFKYVKGNLDWFGKLVFLYRKYFNPPTTMYGLVFGVAADFHGKGVEGAMIKYAEKIVRSETNYKDTVITWIGDFNPKMLKVMENLGAEQYRTFATYRYIFDSTIPFERAKNVN